MKNTLKQSLLGKTVEFDIAYPLDAAKRFKRNWQVRGTDVAPIDRCQVKEGVIVGMRNVIMANYRYEWDHECGGSATGDTEMVYLVCHDIYKKPIIVRFQDGRLKLKEKNAQI